MSESEASSSVRPAATKVAPIALFVLMDIGIALIATVLAFFIRFEGQIPADFIEIIAPTALAASVLFPLLFSVMGLYGYIWRYASFETMLRIVIGSALGTAILMLASEALSRPPLGRPIPFGTVVLMGLLSFVGFIAIRSFSRLLIYIQATTSPRRSRRVLVVGAGDAGALLIQDIRNRRDLDYKVIGLVDDDRGKRGRSIRGVRILGDVDMLPDIALREGVDELLVAVPSATPREMQRILAGCGETKLPTKIMSGIGGSGGQVGTPQLEEVGLDHFLGRDPVEIDLESVKSTIRGQVVCVTGAAGSIGAELCRQIAGFGPRRLLMVEMDESRLYETALEIKEVSPDSAWMALCDIRDRAKLGRVFAEHKPTLVVHAAAYKHVPLMQYEPDEAVKANVLGTRNVVESAIECGAEHVVLISTDKAVEPTSVMGATKYLAERILFSHRDQIRCTAVRFGNVLGSRGSVIPLFEQKLQRGEAIQITHPEMTRYFMTISEAAELVLQAQAMSLGEDLYVLDMGDPVHLLDLAQAIIEMQGRHAGVEFSGLRPAEKMHEILVTGDEQLLPTSTERILKLSSIPEAVLKFDDRVQALVAAGVAGDIETLADELEALCPECPLSAIGRKAE